MKSQIRFRDSVIMCSTAISRRHFAPLFLLPFLIQSVAISGLSQSKTVRVQPEIQFQRMDGFGISLGNVGAKIIMSQSADKRSKLLEMLFGPSGLRANIIRAGVTWSGKRLPMTHPLYLRGFMYQFTEEENETDLFQLFREAQRHHEMLWNACVWTPPVQWKDNQSLEGGELLPQHYEDFATYLAAYLQFYRNLRYQRIDVLSLQNEPNQSKSAASCLWKSEQLKSFLKVVTRIFAEKSITTKLMLPDAPWEATRPYVLPIVEDSETRGLLSYVSVHTSGTETTAEPRTELKQLHKRYNLRLWQTEYSATSDQSPAVMPAALRFAKEVMLDLSQAECHAWLGTPFTDPQSGIGGLFSDAGNEWKPTKLFAAFSQFSRFVPRNAVRIAATVASSPLVAFRNPEYNSVILIFLNSGREAANETFESQQWTFERILAYRTSSTEDCSIVPFTGPSGSRISVVLPPESITTFVARIRRVG